MEDKHDMEESQIELAADEEVAPAVQKKSRIKSKLNISIFVAVAVLAGILIYWYGQRIISEKPKQTISPAQQVVAKQLAEDPELKRFLNPTTGEVWYDKPRPIAPQGYFKLEQEEFYADQNLSEENLRETIKNSTPTYFEVGTREKNTVILALLSYGPGDPTAYIFEESSAGEVMAILAPSVYTKLGPGDRDSYTSMYADVIKKISETIHYDSLSIPAKLTLENGESVTRLDYTGIGGGPSQPTEGVIKKKVADYGRNKLYLVERKYSDTGLTNIGYELQTAINTYAYLDYAPVTRSLEKYSWNNNVPAQGKNYDDVVVFDELAAIARGCGGVRSAATRIDTLKKSELVVVGKTDTGKSVYLPKNTDVSVVKKAYEEYVYWQKNGYRPSRIALSKEEFLKQHGLVVVENASKDLLVYVRMQMAPSYGCAKPVVYLYPTQTTNVDVRVGADVKISDPFYPSGGWRNVTATPRGELTYKGVSYGSLFWEGPGNGDYPNVQKGIVVPREKAEGVMRLQLVQQGLNTKEIGDFMEFWIPKIPNRPYVRLTWLTTEQMNQLAPLYVTPKPDTTIRVFLEMEGYDKSFKLPAQKFVAPVRSGFTLVEWGGLSQL